MGRSDTTERKRSIRREFKKRLSSRHTNTRTTHLCTTAPPLLILRANRGHRVMRQYESVKREGAKEEEREREGGKCGRQGPLPLVLLVFAWPSAALLPAITASSAHTYTHIYTCTPTRSLFHTRTHTHTHTHSHLSLGMICLVDPEEPPSTFSVSSPASSQVSAAFFLCE